MKKIVLNQAGKIVSASFTIETSLEEALYTVEGLLKALGFCFKGRLIVEDKNEKD